VEALGTPDRRIWLPALHSRPASVPAPTSTVAPTATALATARSTATPAEPTPSPGRPARTPLRIDDLFYDGTGTAEPDEYVALANVAAHDVDLTGWQLVSVRGDQVYRFADGFRMPAGAQCRLYTNEVHPEACALSWGMKQAVWRNAGDKAELLDATGALVDWFCYGDYADQCPSGAGGALSGHPAASSGSGASTPATGSFGPTGSTGPIDSIDS
jgi:hypothetical protein